MIFVGESQRRKVFIIIILYSCKTQENQRFSASEIFLFSIK